jgi:hypothetical protein
MVTGFFGRELASASTSASAILRSEAFAFLIFFVQWMFLR